MSTSNQDVFYVENLLDCFLGQGVISSGIYIILNLTVNIIYSLTVCFSSMYMYMSLLEDINYCSHYFAWHGYTDINYYVASIIGVYCMLL